MTDELINMANDEFLELFEEFYGSSPTKLARDVGMTNQMIAKYKAGTAQPTELLMQYLRAKSEIARLEKRQAAADMLARAVRELADQPCDR